MAAVFNNANYDFNGLYNVQTKARDSLKYHFVPRFSPREGGSPAARFICNLVHDGLGAVSWTAQKVGSAVGSVFSFIVPNFVKNRMYPVNPVNGRRHVILVPAAVEKFFGDWIISPVTTLFESPSYAMTFSGREISAETRVGEVFNRLLVANDPLLHSPDEGAWGRFDYRTRIFRSDQINASAVPAGEILMYDKMITELDNSFRGRVIRSAVVKLPEGSSVEVDLTNVTLDDALAALLAHEITHVASRHSLIAITSERLFKYLTFPIRALSKAVASKVRYMCELASSREQEYEADITGTYMAARAGFNPLGALYLQEFIRREESWPLQFFHNYIEYSGHPGPVNRMRAVLAAAGKIDPGRLAASVVWTKADHGQDLAYASPSTLIWEELYREINLRVPG